MTDQQLMTQYKKCFDDLLKRHQIAMKKLVTQGWQVAASEFEDVVDSASALSLAAEKVMDRCSIINSRDFPNHWAETIKVLEEPS